MKKVLFSLIMLTAAGAIFPTTVKRISVISAAPSPLSEEEKIEWDADNMTQEQISSAIKTATTEAKNLEGQILQLIPLAYSGDIFKRAVKKVELNVVAAEATANNQKLNELKIANEYAAQKSMSFFSEEANKALSSDLKTMVTNPAHAEVAADSVAQELIHLKKEVQILRTTVRSLLENNMVATKATKEGDEQKQTTTKKSSQSKTASKK